jgi:hypothetical protein
MAHLVEKLSPAKTQRRKGFFDLPLRLCVFAGAKV